ncbi:CobW family GTP-binding protein [Limnohabitans sp. 103DPR2]|uniref:CobW family GTP-binding protein n=1 Tax=Limnohabitans sp. 103DPR2 TaxID=1678129 RepID=UPI0006DC5781|nr:GTP-binding protein [Limnohabitans sp. 103DPR2]ALK90607.1 putative GTP-binding protein YjiA [Limnohabitans sp. 103DPR2]
MNPLDKRIPVYLLTGYLGSGKTSLLKAWLGQDAFKDAALVINELGEVGLDNQLLSGATESAALVASACVCCTGLPGLAEALEDLFWARLERRMPRFPNLVIETTGLAEPGPVAEALRSSDLLKERYRLAGVITCLSASTADAVLKQHAEARAQLADADVLVITKTDLVSDDHLAALTLRVQHQLAHLELEHAPHLLTSAQARLSADDVLASLALRAASQAPGPFREFKAVTTLAHGLHLHRPGEHCDICEGTRASAHAAQALWWPLVALPSLAEVCEQVQALQSTLGSELLRLKGRVQTPEGAHVIQLAPFETHAEVCQDELPWSDTTRSGFTVIVSSHLSAASAQWLTQHGMSSLAA